jgi:glycosyltransferase involved in cell wall biosynthesis
MTRLLVVASGMGVGGAETQLKVLVQSLSETKFEVMLVSLVGEEVLSFGDNIKVIQPKFDLDQGIMINVLSILKLMFLFFSYRPHLIQGWMYGGNIVAGLAKICVPTAPLYLGIRASNMDKKRYKYHFFINKLISYFASGVVYNSFTGWDYHISKGFNKSRANVIQNGICTKRFRPDNNSRNSLLQKFGISKSQSVVIYPARLDPMKDHKLVIQIAGLLPEVRFVFIGLGVENLHAPANCILLGRVLDPELYYNMADLTVSFSKFGEGFSNVIGESLACGVPVLANSVGDSACILSGLGFVTQNTKPEDLAEEIKFLLRDKKKLRHISKMGRRRVIERFGVKSMVESYIRLYKKN